MKHLYIVAAVAATLTSGAAFADTSNFDGFSIQVSSGIEQSKAGLHNIYLNGAPTQYTRSDVSSNNTPLNIGIDYTTSLNDKFTLGILAEMNPLNTKLGTSSQYLAGVPSGSNVDDTIKVHGQWGISLVPGYKINNESLGYLKFSYLSAKIDQTPINGTAATLRNMNGYGIGVGYKHTLSQKWQAFAETNYKKYTDKTALVANSLLPYTNSAVLNGYNILFGISYKF